MSLLGEVLDLEDGARLTGVAILPSLERVPGLRAFTAVHRIRLGGATDPGPVAGALGALVRSAVVTLQGNEPDGGAWVAVIQLVDTSSKEGYRALGEGPLARLERAARVEVSRALDLLGMNLELVSTTLTDDDLLTELNLMGAVWGIWSPAEGLLAQVCCLATGMTEEEAVGAGGAGCAREFGIDSEAFVQEREARFERLNQVLFRWAEAYEGPD